MKDVSTLLPAYLIRLFADCAFPKWLAAISIGLLEYLAPETSPRVFIATCGLIVFDTVTGIVRAWATGQKVESAKLVRFVTKVFTYFAAIVVFSFGCDAIPDIQAFHRSAVTGLLGLIALTELKSNLENLHAIRPDLWGVILDAFSRGFAKSKGGKA